MKEYFLKREGVIRLLSLIAITVSVFLDEPVLKVGLLVLGIGGLITLAWYRKQKVTLIIFCVLFVATLAVYYLKSIGTI
ncbi:hypothetical protein P0M11_02725 [Kaistella sp. PBT33-4]|mgnify:CR=1 FL=1|uniref:hypothetical protein n=1 Tax=Kaistella sp. PBT33-4 TaxID=3032000 RepID=UPI0023D7FD34|nr:hypothetical protein [Kaistella sp. PBT33-4]MDF0718906.1 hypothetical protein [Kaistella sp. PBT33-4]